MKRTFLNYKVLVTLPLIIFLSACSSFYIGGQLPRDVRTYDGACYFMHYKLFPDPLFKNLSDGLDGLRELRFLIRNCDAQIQEIMEERYGTSI